MRATFLNRSFDPDTTATGHLLTEPCKAPARAHGCRASRVASVPLLAADGAGVE